MPSRTNRLLIAVALLFVGTGIFAFPGNADAAGRTDFIRRGIYPGKWHGDKVKFIIEKVSRDGTFSGIVHFDPTSNWPNAKFDFSGQINRRDSLTIQRAKENCDQVARTGLPRREGRDWVWRGDVTGACLDKAYPFELRIPR